MLFFNRIAWKKTAFIMQKMFCYSVRSEAYKIELSHENYLINYLEWGGK